MCAFIEFLERIETPAKRARFGPKRAQIGPKLKIVANLSCDLSQFAQEGHLTNEKNIIIWCSSWEKIPKNSFIVLATFFLEGCGGGMLGRWAKGQGKLKETCSPSFFYGEISTPAILQQQLQIDCLWCFCFAVRQIKLKGHMISLRKLSILALSRGWIFWLFSLGMSL